MRVQAKAGTQLKSVPVQRHQIEPAPPWITIVWNDPVNLMSYVAYVFESYFGFKQEHAHELMMQVHTQGRAVVSTGSREAVERDVQAMHEFGLWATMAKQEL